MQYKTGSSLPHIFLSRLRILLLVFSLVLPLVSFSQGDIKLEVPIKIKVNEGNLDGAEVTIIKNGGSPRKLPFSAKFSLKLDLNANYIIKFTKPGFITKSIEINTTVPDSRANDGFDPYPFELKLFKQYDGVNIVVFDQPVAKIAFSNEIDDFDYNVDYTKSILSDVKEAEAQLEKKQKEEEQKPKTTTTQPVANQPTGGSSTADAAKAKAEAEAAKAAEAERQKQLAAENEAKKQQAKAEEDKKRLAAQAAEEDRKRQAALAEEDRKKQAAKADEDRRKQAAAAADEEKRLQAEKRAEDERKFQAAKALEEENKKKNAEAAAEAERNRIAAKAADDEKKRLAAAAAEEQRKQAAAAAAEENNKRKLAVAAEEEERKKQAALREAEANAKLLKAKQEREARIQSMKVTFGDDERSGHANNEPPSIVSRETITEDKRTITKTVIRKGNTLFTVEEIQYKWGGLFYFVDGQSATKNTVDLMTSLKWLPEKSGKK